jgi:hypothetical protein
MPPISKKRKRLRANRINGYKRAKLRQEAEFKRAETELLNQFRSNFDGEVRKIAEDITSYDFTEDDYAYDLELHQDL